MLRLIGIMLSSAIIALALACDDGETIRVANTTSSDLDLFYNYSGDPGVVGATVVGDNCIVCSLQPSTDGSFADLIADPEFGRKHAYTFTARETTSNIIIYSRVFTWDELKDMDWRVVITDMRE